MSCCRSLRPYGCVRVVAVIIPATKCGGVTFFPKTGVPLLFCCCYGTFFFVLLRNRSLLVSYLDFSCSSVFFFQESLSLSTEEAQEAMLSLLESRAKGILQNVKADAMERRDANILKAAERLLK